MTMIFMSDELRNTAFSNKFRGYDPEQVEDFIDKVLECYDNLAEEYLSLENNFKELAEKIGDIEKAKNDAIKLVSAAKLEGEAVIEASKKQANKIVASAVAEADRISRDSQLELNSHSRAVSELEKEREALREDIIRICSGYIKSASSIEDNNAVDSIMEEIGAEIIAEPPIKQEIAKAEEVKCSDNIPEEKAAPDLDAFVEDAKPQNPFDTSFLRPSSGDGDPDAKLYTRSTRLRGAPIEDEDDGTFGSVPARQSVSESSTIADLATSLKSETRETIESITGHKAEKRMSYDEMMQSLGNARKNDNGRDPLKFLK